jgi:hypothetical protein
LLDNHLLAAREIKAFRELSSGFYSDPETGKSILPWEFRVLAVRLQALGVSDWRRCIGTYYELGLEARSGALDAALGLEERELWRKRLTELGIRVANVLVELGDLGAAARHLEGMRRKQEDPTVRQMLTLLYVRAGMLEAAKECASNDEALGALLAMAEGRWAEAAERWGKIDGEMERCNAAVCMIYEGKLSEVTEFQTRVIGHVANRRQARQCLEKLVDDAKVFPGVVFNLATVYELCGDRSKVLKMQLAEKVAKTGKEMTNTVFKM